MSYTGITLALSKGRIFEETLPLLAAAGKGINPNNPLARHSGEGRNPVRKKNRKADKTVMLSRLRGRVLIRWIPASAGMTQFYLMDNPG